MSKKTALCIGINDYPGTESDLNGCVNDAQDWAAELSSRGFEVSKLLNKKATGKAIRKSLQRCAVEAEAGDLVVITYSGHGTFIIDEDGDEQDGMDECWCPYDISTEGPITDDELNLIFTSRKPGVRWLVLSDSCHSGTVSRFGAMSDDAGNPDADQAPRARFLPPETFERGRRMAARTGLADARFSASAPGRNSALLISGCQDSEYSWDAYFAGRPNGAFTFEALRALRAIGPGSSYADWHAQIRLRLPAARFPQTPNLYGDQEMFAWEVLAPAAEDGSSELASQVQQSGDRSPARVGRALASRVIEQRRTARSMGAELQKARGDRNREKRVLLAEGDSWFAFPMTNVLSCLEDEHGFEVFSDAENGDLIENMAYSEGFLDKFLRTIHRLKRNGIGAPKAILLSGGGNDVVGEPFAELLNHALSPNPGINKRVLEGIVHERLRDAYITILNSITELCETEYGEPIKVITHGYDNAVPDGRGFRGWWFSPFGPWMKPGFDRKGYKDVQANRAHVEELIDALNTMLAGLSAERGLEHVQHLNLQGRLPNGPEYKRWWVDELHPTRRGFQRVAEEFVRLI